MRIFYDNYIDAAAASVANKTSEATNFPAENLRNAQRSKPWRTTGTVAEEWVSFDLGSAQEVKTLVVLDHTLVLASDTLVKIQADSSNNFLAPDFDETVTLTAATWVLHNLSVAQSFRYWRFVFTKPSAATIRDIGRIYLGTYYDPTDPPDFDGFTRSAVDLSLKTRTPYGAVFGDTRPQYRRLRFDFTRIPDAQKVQLAAIATAVGTVTPFFVQVDDSAADELGEPVYVVHRDVPDFEVAGYDGESKWNTRLDLEEVL